MLTQTVRLIETVQLNLLKAILRLYGTFNRVIKENFRTVRLIETVLIIESLEYLSKLIEYCLLQYKIPQLSFYWFEVSVEIHETLIGGHKSHQSCPDIQGLRGSFLSHKKQNGFFFMFEV